MLLVRVLGLLSRVLLSWPRNFVPISTSVVAAAAASDPRASTLNLEATDSDASLHAVHNRFTFHTSSRHASIVEHGKRQPFSPEVLHRTMLAAIYFTCPEGGSKHRTFRWQARYNRMSGIINIYGLENIDYFEKIKVSLRDFDVYMHHSFCNAMAFWPYSICFYHIKMHIYGRVNLESISMGVTMMSSDVGRRPSVKEGCVYSMTKPRLSNHSSCSSSSSSTPGKKTKNKKPQWDSHCHIDDLRVYLIPN